MTDKDMQAMQSIDVHHGAATPDVAPVGATPVVPMDGVGLAPSASVNPSKATAYDPLDDGHTPIRCAHCGAQVIGCNGTCPLCGAPIASVQTALYPPRAARVGRYILPFTHWYMLLSALVMVAAVVCNIVLPPTTHYWAIVWMGLMTVYHVVRRTVLGQENIYYRLLRLTIMLLLLLVTVAEVLHAQEVYQWVLPAVYLACWLTTMIIARCQLLVARQYISSLFALDLMAVPILAHCLLRGIDWIPTAVVCGLALINATVWLAACPHQLVAQWRRNLGLPPAPLDKE